MIDIIINNKKNILEDYWPIIASVIVLHCKASQYVIQKNIILKNIEIIEQFPQTTWKS